MKRFLLAIFLVLAIVGVMLWQMPKPLEKVISLKNASCNIFCQSATVQSVSVGFGKIVSCDGENFFATATQCNNVDGVSFSWRANASDVDKLVLQLNGKVYSKQTFGNSTVLCGYSPKLKGKLFVDGNATNFQIAFDGVTLTIGSPLILDSF